VVQQVGSAPNIPTIHHHHHHHSLQSSHSPSSPPTQQHPLQQQYFILHSRSLPIILCRQVLGHNDRAQAGQSFLEDTMLIQVKDPLRRDVVEVGGSVVRDSAHSRVSKLTLMDTPTTATTTN